jgi:2-phospho-L-lactate guanylyltransferase (CobY/MobA/RfbA family)
MNGRNPDSSSVNLRALDEFASSARETVVAHKITNVPVIQRGQLRGEIIEGNPGEITRIAFAANPLIRRVHVNHVVIANVRQDVFVAQRRDDGFAAQQTRKWRRCSPSSSPVAFPAVVPPGRSSGLDFDAECCCAGLWRRRGGLCRCRRMGQGRYRRRS